MLFVDPVISGSLEYFESTERIDESHSPGLMIASQITSPWLDRVDFLFWSHRQSGADIVIDYDV